MTTDNTTLTAAPADRWCSWHETTHPVDEFGFKDKAAGTYQSKCRVGQREYSRAHYQRNRTKRIAQVSVRNSQVRGRLREVLAAELESRHCGVCGVSGRDERLVAFVASGHSPSQLITREVPAGELVGVLDADGTVLRCRHCTGQTIGTARRDAHSPLRTSTVAVALRELLADVGAARVSELLDVIAERCGAPVDYTVLMSVAAREARRGTIVRVDRGVYASA